jgi:23S rRNA pseudouridine2604 synthase
MRVNKFLVECGYCSRREADDLLAAGKVAVNGARVAVGAVMEVGDEVKVGERTISARTKKHVYIALNKPIGVECTTDPEVKDNIVEFVDHPERVFPIGRLDKDSSGLILLTSDGDIVNKLLRHEHQHEKEYWVTVDRPVTTEFLAKMARGVNLPRLRVTTRPCQTSRLGKFAFAITLTQGLNRQIRRMCLELGFNVKALTRVRFVNIAIGHLKPGRWRNLTPAELSALLTAKAPAPARPPRRAARRPGRTR